jgi:hypothetical protein
MATTVFDPSEHPELSNVRDRTADRPEVERVYFGEGDFAQASDVNEAFTREFQRRKAVGDLVAKDGDRLSGADIIIDTDAGTVQITAGILYLIGAPRAVDQTVLTGVPMVGDVALGVRVVETIITAADDNLFYGLVEGTEAYGEEGAVRTTLATAWGFVADSGEDDGGVGDFFQYVLMRDGVVVANQAPTNLTGVQKQIQSYDFGAHGNYIVKGCSVRAMKLDGENRLFSIGAGEANVNGIKVIRTSDARIAVLEDPDFGTVNAEPHTFDTSGTSVITVRHPPIAAIDAAIITKQRTVTLVKGVTGSTDPLPDDSVTSIVSVVQGATTYVATTDYVRSGDAVSWAPAGAEPTTGSSYDVTYQYLDQVDPDTFTDRKVTLSGGVVGKDVFLAYTYKLPRQDRICLTEDGDFEYVRGESSPTNPHPPQEPDTALSLCVVENDWFGKPTIVNDGTTAMTFKQLNAVYERLIDALDLIAIERLKTKAISRSPGLMLGVFTDPFKNDDYRDLGETQTAAVFEGTLQIAIDPTFQKVRLSSLGMLNYTTEPVIKQDLATGCVKINPYMNFRPLPIDISIDPERDFWVDVEEVTNSETTKVIGRHNRQRVKKVETVTTVDREKLRYLREIDIDFRIEGMGAGETLAELTFGGVDVNPGGLVANSQGVITGTFTIPAEMPSGRKAVKCVGGSGRKATTRFRGQGILETDTTNIEITIIERFRDDPPIDFPVYPDDDTAWPNDGRGGNDPQAQTFVLNKGRHIASVSLKFCAIGNRNNDVIIDIVAVGNEGFPTQHVLNSIRVDMTSVVANQWTDFVFKYPLYQPKDTYLAFVVKTDDANHSISIATLGDFDADAQKYVTKQPYTAGDRFDGSNSLSWKLHPNSDITYRLNACVFSPLTKTINVGTFAVSNVSDIMVLAAVFLPEAGTSVVFQVDVGGTLYNVLPEQNIELTSFYTGNVKVNAILTGKERASPILSRDILIVFGTMQASGTYIGTSFTMGNPVDVHAEMSTWLPGGSTLSVQVDKNDDSWQNMTLTETTPIDEGFVEYSYEKTAFAAPDGGRIKITLTGTPAARPAIADLRAFTV